MKDKQGYFLGLGALASGSTVALTSLCCIGPIAAGALGVSAAAVGSKLTPYQPYFFGLTFVFLGLAFFQAYRSDGCAADTCATPRGRRTQRLVLWIIAVVALVLSTSAYWMSLLVYLTL